MSLPPPEGYGTQQMADELIDILYEAGPGCEIYWFHWPRNGFIRRPDFEPLIYVYYPNGALCIVAVRRDWIWKEKDAEDVAQPVQVVFRRSNHAPYIKDKAQAADYDREIQGLVRLQKAHRPAQPGEIPTWNVGGLNPVNVYDECERLSRRCGATYPRWVDSS